MKFDDHIKQLKTQLSDFQENTSLQQFSREELQEQLSIHQVELFAQFEELQDSQQRLQSHTNELLEIIDTLPQAVAITDDFSKIEYLNPAAKSLLSTIKPKGRKMFNGYFTASSEILPASVTSFLSWLTTTEIDKIQVNVDSRWFELTKRQYRNIKWLIAFEEITARKSSEKHSRIWQNYSVDGIHILDSKGNLIDYSPSFLEMLGYTESEASQLNKSDWDINLSADNIQSTLETLFNKQTDWTVFETDYKRKDGSIFSAEVSVRRIYFEDNEYLYASARDVTEKVKLRSALKGQNRLLLASEERANQANAAKSEFLANMSHELRTPMHGINSFIQIASKRSTEDNVKSYLEKAKVSVDRLTNLLNLLLDLSKIESGKMSVNKEKLNIAQSLKDAVNTIDTLAQAKRIKIDFIEVSDTEVFYDATLMTQLFVNLAGNAIKYSPEDTSIKINLKKLHPESVEIAIYDQGIGFPADELDKVFDKFYQTTRSKTGAGGTGLGLAISKEIVDLHQGKIWIESPPKDQENGSVIFIQLPIENPDDAKKPKTQETVKYKVLAIDDDPVILRIIKGFLESEGHQVTTSESPFELERLIKQHDPEVLICDINMPGKSGIITMAQARNLKEDLQIISISSDLSLVSSSESFADITMAKPLDKDQLVKSLKGKSE